MTTDQSLNQNQLQEASGIVDAGVTAALGSQSAELYRPHEQTLPRPDYGTAVMETYGDQGVAYLGGLVLESSELSDLHSLAWHNMRIALGRVGTDNRVLWYPAAILPEASAVYLETDIIRDPANNGAFSELQHLGLDNAYLTATSDAQHGKSNANTAESKHGLILASQPAPSGIHQTVHTIDRSGDFTTVANARGLQDIGVKGRTRQVRPRVIRLPKVYSVAIRPEFQPANEPLFGLQSISAQQLLIAGTLAAATSRGLRVNVENNITEMVSRPAS